MRAVRPEVAAEARILALPGPADWVRFRIAERARRPQAPPLLFLRHAAIAWASCALLVLALPVAVGLFGSERRPEGRALAAVAPAPRLELASRLVARRLGEVQSDLRWAGAAVWATRSLYDPHRRAAAVDVLQGFVSTRDWCTSVALASPAGTPVSARRGGEPMACGALLAIATRVSPGTVLLDRVPSPSGDGARLCFGLSIESDGAGPAALVAQADPAVLFSGMAALGEARPFLADGQGHWLLGPPSGTGPLLREGVALSSWQGPAGGRWQVAVADPSWAGRAGRVPPAGEETGLLLLAALPVALVVALALSLRRRFQRA